MFNVQCIDKLVKCNFGYHRLIVLLFLSKLQALWLFFVLKQSFTTNQLDHKGKHQKFLDVSSSLTPQPEPNRASPPSAQELYITDTIAEHHISQLSLCVCANQNQDHTNPIKKESQQYPLKSESAFLCLKVI